MIRLRADSEKAVERFIQRVVETQTVWLLDDDGWVAGSRSHQHEDRDVFPFFSAKAYAKRGAACWDDRFPVVSIPLATFMDVLLPGYIENDQLVGPDWDGSMAGSEVEPDDLRSQIEIERAS